MNINDYKENSDVNTNFKPQIQNGTLNIFASPENKAEIHINNRDGKIHVDEFFNLIDSRKSKKFYNYFGHYAKHFILAYLFKGFFKLSRNLDKSKTGIISINKFLNIMLDPSNIKFGMFIILIKVMFKIFRILLSKINIEIIEYKRINFIFGLLMSFLGILIGKKSTLIFYSVLFFLIKNLICFINTYKQVEGRRVRDESKNLYYIGFSLGFIIMTLVNYDIRNKIKLIKNIY
jgi:hypothetical protein